MILPLFLASIIVSMTLGQTVESNRPKPECGRLPESLDVIPWNVAIFKKIRINPYVHICGGTLVSNNIVISAAHCFGDHQQNSPADIKDFAVAVGKVYKPWNNTKDTHAQTSEISEIKRDPHYFGALTNFQSDIVVLVLKSPVEFNAHVSPACFDFDRAFEKDQLKSGNKGMVTGWGLGNGIIQITPTVVNVPVLTVAECLTESAGFAPYITSDKICLGDKNGTGISRGFGGAGVTFPQTEGGVTRHYLRGVISSAPHAVDEDATPTIVTVTLLSKYEELIKENFY